jgi:long-chain acyl-CoA synthetase
MLTNDNLAALMHWVPLVGLDTGAVNLVATPLFHIGGCGWALLGMATGASTVVVRDFEERAVVEQLRAHAVTHTLLVPAMLRLIDLVSGGEPFHLPHLRAIVYGASPISEDLLARSMRTLGADFYQWYGLTETTGPVTQLDPCDHRGDAPRLTSAGKPAPHVALGITDPDTCQPILDGSVGEVWVRSGQVMRGYWHNDAATRGAVTPEGWFRTGDIGYLRDGYLYLHDRVKDMIVTGGENVYPTEVENVLMAHPQVTDVAVFGVPSDAWGEEVKAAVVTCPGAGLSESALLDFARRELAGYKVPKSCDFLPALPRTPTGKVLKKELRAPYWSGRDRHVG